MEKSNIEEKLIAYAATKSKVKALEENLKEMNAEILEHIEKDPIKREFGTFTKASRKSYSYSEKIMAQAEKLKIAQHKEVEKGIAEVKETFHLRFTEPKQK